jgi:hypothetical protein
MFGSSLLVLLGLSLAYGSSPVSRSSASTWSAFSRNSMTDVSLAGRAVARRRRPQHPPGVCYNIGIIF